MANRISAERHAAMRWRGLSGFLGVAMSAVIALGLTFGLPSRVAASDNLLHYAGGAVVTGAPKVYLIFWGSGWGMRTFNANGDMTFSNDLYGGAPRLQEMYKGLGTNGELWSGVMTQYCQGVALSATVCPNSSAHVAYPDGHALAGVYYDNQPVPINATKQQIGGEAVTMAELFGNSPNAQFVIASPPGSRPEGFPSQATGCARHDDASASFGTVVYTNLPYVMDLGVQCGMGVVNGGGPAGYLDGYTFAASHEFAESITDPILSWGWGQPGSGAEAGDMCLPPLDGFGPSQPVNVRFSTGTFAMTALWSNDTNTCETAHSILPVRVLVPNLVGETVAQAKQVLLAHGLVLGSTSSHVDCNNLGLVTSQNPLAGNLVLAGTAVNITVGTKPSPPAVCS